MSFVCEGSFREATRYSDLGIAYAAEHDLDAYRWYLTATRSRVALSIDDWQAATADAAAVVALDSVSPITRMIGLQTLGRIAARVGDEQSVALLDEAFDIASATGEPQRLAPVFAALAEGAWLRSKSVRPDVLAASTGALRSRFAWEQGEVAVWLTRLGHPVDLTLPADIPYAYTLAGEHAAAHAAWVTRGCYYEAALAAIDGHDVHTLRAAAEWLGRQGATAVLQRASARLRQLGATGVRAPRPATVSNPAGLTQREVDVLSLVEAGLPDRDIAERLVLSPRTVHHHVAAVLRKLDVTSRRDAGEAARSRGVNLPST